MNQRNHEDAPADQFILENQADQARTPVDGSIRVGRDPACDLVLASEKSSRVHAVLSVSEGALWVEDQNSTNGTLVNKKRVRENTRLEGGDIVQFGDVRFRVIAPAPKAGEPDDQGTVMFGQQTMLHMTEDEGKPAEPEQALAEGGRPDAGASGAAEGKRREAAREEAESAPSREQEKPAQAAPEPEEPEAPSIESRSGGDPSIPRSWADADQLEQASHTAFVARPRKSGAGAEELHPLKAISEARRNIPAEEAILVGLTKPIQGKPFKLSRKGGTEKWEMGRGKGADIDIDDESVSGRHAQLICESGRWKVVNMMSVNGTFVNERKVLSAYLTPGDVIRMGTVSLAFDARVEKPKSKAPARKPSRSEQGGTGGMASTFAQKAGRFWKTLIGRLRGKR